MSDLKKNIEKNNLFENGFGNISLEQDVVIERNDTGHLNLNLNKIPSIYKHKLKVEKEESKLKIQQRKNNIFHHLFNPSLEIPKSKKQSSVNKFHKNCVSQKKY